MRLALVAALVLSTVSFAQSSPGTQGRKAPTSEVKFDENELIDGTLQAPEGQLVNGGHTTKFDSMIRVRTDFADKLKASVNELR